MSETLTLLDNIPEIFQELDLKNQYIITKCYSVEVPGTSSSSNDDFYYIPTTSIEDLVEKVNTKNDPSLKIYLNVLDAIELSKVSIDNEYVIICTLTSPRNPGIFCHSYLLRLRKKQRKYLSYFPDEEECFEFF